MQYGITTYKSNSGAVFDTVDNFRFVYHFDENEKSELVKDATSGGNTGILEGVYSFSDGLSGSGIVWQDIKPTTLTASKDILYKTGEELSFVFESWIKRTSITNSDNYLFSIKINDSLQCGLVFERAATQPFYESYDTLGTKRNN
jgi:hypothetical protein